MRCDVKYGFRSRAGAEQGLAVEGFAARTVLLKGECAGMRGVKYVPSKARGLV